MSSLLRARSISTDEEAELGGQMSFLEHLDELRSRLIRSILFVFIATTLAWFVSDRIYNFLAVPVERALAEAQQRHAPIAGLTGQETVLPLSSAKEGQMGLFTDEALYTASAVIPKGVRLPVDFHSVPQASTGINDKLIVTSALEPFSLYIKVSLYAAICVSVPFLLFQIWAFVSPGLYPHERAYVTPFIALSSISFVLGAAFAYYVIFPPAARYLLGLGQDFRLLLKADDYFDFIIIVMLGMGVVFQMPAITYVLSRIGLITAGLLVRIWKTALIVILVAAAVLSPTNDIPNMLLFAAPMIVLYVVSIFVAWIFTKPRTAG
jgi:sec-independent protein translocase protein TatC